MNSYSRITFVVVAGILCCCSLALAQTIITSFTAEPQGDEYVSLEWKTENEAGVTLFRPERSFDGISFSPLEDLPPTGNNSTYRYDDYDLNRTGNHTYYYRIRVLLSDGSSVQSPVQSVTLAFSGIQQTWGSIKALFR